MIYQALKNFHDDDDILYLSYSEDYTKNMALSTIQTKVTHIQRITNRSLEHRYIDEWMEEWVDGWMDELTDGCVGG